MLLSPEAAAALPLPHEIARSQRWRDRRTHFLRPDSVIDPDEFSVGCITTQVAAAFVRDHHYLGSLPVCRMSVGLYRNAKPASRLVGVACFSVPVNSAAIPLHTGLSPKAGVELGRFVLLDEVAANGETYFLRRAFRLLRASKPDLEAVTAYSDPMPRIGPDGSTILPGHCGGIYAAYSQRTYRGQRPRRKELLTPDGHVFPSRAISKIRNAESGSGYATDLLVSRGAPRPTGHDLRSWFDGLVASGFLTARWHPGVHAYAFALTMKARLAARSIPSPPPPIRAPRDRHSDVTGLAPLFAR